MFRAGACGIDHSQRPSWTPKLRHTHTHKTHTRHTHTQHAHNIRTQHAHAHAHAHKHTHRHAHTCTHGHAPLPFSAPPATTTTRSRAPPRPSPPPPPPPHSPSSPWRAPSECSERRADPHLCCARASRANISALFCDRVRTAPYDAILKCYDRVCTTNQLLKHLVSGNILA